MGCFQSAVMPLDGTDKPLTTRPVYGELDWRVRKSQWTGQDLTNQKAKLRRAQSELQIKDSSGTPTVGKKTTRYERPSTLPDWRERKSYWAPADLEAAKRALKASSSSKAKKRQAKDSLSSSSRRSPKQSSTSSPQGPRGLPGGGELPPIGRSSNASTSTSSPAMPPKSSLASASASPSKKRSPKASSRASPQGSPLGIRALPGAAGDVPPIGDIPEDGVVAGPTADEESAWRERKSLWTPIDLEAQKSKLKKARRPGSKRISSSNSKNKAAKRREGSKYEVSTDTSPNTQTPADWRERRSLWTPVDLQAKKSELKVYITPGGFDLRVLAKAGQALAPLPRDAVPLQRFGGHGRLTVMGKADEANVKTTQPEQSDKVSRRKMQSDIRHVKKGAPGAAAGQIGTALTGPSRPRIQFPKRVAPLQKRNLTHDMPRSSTALEILKDTNFLNTLHTDDLRSLGQDELSQMFDMYNVSGTGVLSKTELERLSLDCVERVLKMYGDKVRMKNPKMSEERLARVIEEERCYLLPNMGDRSGMGNKSKDANFGKKDCTQEMAKLIQRKLDINRTGQVSKAKLLLNWQTVADEIFKDSFEKNHLDCVIL